MNKIGKFYILNNEIDDEFYFSKNHYIDQLYYWYDEKSDMGKILNDVWWNPYKNIKNIKIKCCYLTFVKDCIYI